MWRIAVRAFEAGWQLCEMLGRMRFLHWCQLLKRWHLLCKLTRCIHRLLDRPDKCIGPNCRRPDCRPARCCHNESMDRSTLEKESVKISKNESQKPESWTYAHWSSWSSQSIPYQYRKWTDKVELLLAMSWRGLENIHHRMLWSCPWLCR